MEQKLNLIKKRESSCYQNSNNFPLLGPRVPLTNHQLRVLSATIQTDLKIDKNEVFIQICKSRFRVAVGS